MILTVLLNLKTSIRLGFSAARDFEPAIRFKSNFAQRISFTLTEFGELVKRTPLMETHLYERSKQFVDREEKFDVIIVHLTTQNGKRIVKFKNHDGGSCVDRRIKKKT